MTWLVFGFVWGIGGVYFSATVGYDFMHSRHNRDISMTQAASLIIASGPLVWLVMLAVWAGWLR